MAETYRVLLYSHDSQGLGHVRRNLAIAHNLARRLPGAIDADVAGLLVTGLAPASRFPLPEGFDWVTIPGITKGRDGYRPRNLSGATGDLIKLRSRLLQATLLGFKPDLVIIDRHIYGVWSELREPLMWLREQHPAVRVVLGLRGVLPHGQNLAVGAHHRRKGGNLQGGSRIGRGAPVDGLVARARAGCLLLRTTGFLSTQRGLLLHHHRSRETGRLGGGVPESPLWAAARQVIHALTGE